MRCSTSGGACSWPPCSLELVGVTAVAAAGEQFLPVLGVREGARGLFGSRVPMATSPI